MTAEELNKTLVAKLKSIYNNKDFVVGILSCIPSMDDRIKMLRYIEKGEDVSDENIILYATHLRQKHK